MTNVKRVLFIVFVLLSRYIRRFSVSCMLDVYFKISIVGYVMYWLIEVTLVQVINITNVIEKSSLHSHVIMHSLKMKLPYFCIDFPLSEDAKGTV